MQLLVLILIIIKKHIQQIVLQIQIKNIKLVLKTIKFIVHVHTLDTEDQIDYVNI